MNPDNHIPIGPIPVNGSTLIHSLTFSLYKIEKDDLVDEEYPMPLGILWVTLKRIDGSEGDTYGYRDVPMAELGYFLLAESMGQFYNRSIRGRYDRVDEIGHAEAVLDQNQILDDDGVPI